MASPTPAPTYAGDSVEALLSKATHYPNTIIQGPVQKNEQEMNDAFWEHALIYNKSFSLIAADKSCLHTAREYMELYPEIEQLTISEVGIFENGILITFKNTTSVFDAEICRAIRTGDFGRLNDTDERIYVSLKNIIEETGVKKMKRVDAVRALHDYLAKELRYDEGFMEDSYTPKGAIFNRTAVCSGYARTMRLLLLMLGIDCKYQSGYAGESHAWNLVLMEDGWYHVDVTWDDPTPDVPGQVSYEYFLVNDEKLSKTHQWESDIRCTGNAYQIYAYTAYLCDSEESMKAVYAKQIKTEPYLYFCYPKGGELTEEIIKDYILWETFLTLRSYPPIETEDYFILKTHNPYFEE